MSGRDHRTGPGRCPTCVDSALNTLPRRERDVVVLRHYADLSEIQVADLLGIGVGTVKSAGSRGLVALSVWATVPTAEDAKLPILQSARWIGPDGKPQTYHQDAK